jgi:hypothetical protein
MGKGQVSSPEPLTILGSVLFSSSRHETTQSQAALGAGELRFVGPENAPKSGLQSFAFEASLWWLSCECAAAKNHKKHKDKGIDRQGSGLKSRTFDNVLSSSSPSLNYTVLSSPRCRRAAFWGS